MKKIRAFTIMEITIVMLITGIVISMAYSVLRTFQLQYKQFYNKTTFSQELTQLDKSIQHDFDNSTYAIVLKDSSMIKMASLNKEIRYRFFDSSIVRIDLKADTFKLIAINFVFRPLDTLTNSSVAILTSLSFTVISRAKERYPFFFHKKYNASLFINGDIDSLNKHINED